MYKIFTIFIAVIITTCLAQRPVRYRNKRIPYEEDDYREGDYDDDRPNDIREPYTRPYDNQGGRFNQLHDMNRQTHFDVGGGRDPPVQPDFNYRGYGGQKPSIQALSQHILNQQPLNSQSLGLQAQQPLQQQPQQQSQQQQPQQPQQPQQLGAGFDGGRAGAFGYTPYGHYTYNPYGYRPGYYGWSRPTQTADPWRGFGLGFPFNLLGLGGGGGSSGYRPWWSGNRWGLFF